jgi:ribosomal protein S12 methylthiotransferase accessory factor YcaO
VSAGRVTVPFKLKLDSSRGPIASVAGVLLEDAGALWASSGAGASASPAVAIAKPMRETALITFRSCA